jgi:galactokinase
VTPSAIRRYVVPGRVELVGKHVDYAGGRSLTCAVDRALRIDAQATPDPALRVDAGAVRGSVVMPLAASARPTNASWSVYVAAVARRFARDFPHFRRGVSVSIRGDLPEGAGLSSSSALIVALGTALADANDAANDDRWSRVIPNALARAEYFAAIETGAPYGEFAGEEGVGVRGGAQDPIAIICGASDAVSQFSYLPGRLERRIPWPADHVLAIGVSGVHAVKTGNAQRQYNQAAEAMRTLVRRWNSETGRHDETVANALASGPDAADRLSRIARSPNDALDVAAEYLAPRLDQFREEVNVIVPGVGDALRDRDWSSLGRLTDRSHALATSALGNQVPETGFLARSARERGAIAASAFGAGFGGAVWAMVREDSSTAFLRAWRADYHIAFPSRAAMAQWIVTKPAEPARELASA